jgi:hypothetical protein
VFLVVRILKASAVVTVKVAFEDESVLYLSHAITGSMSRKGSTHSLANSIF